MKSEYLDHLPELAEDCWYPPGTQPTGGEVPFVVAELTRGIAHLNMIINELLKERKEKT